MPNTLSRKIFFVSIALIILSWVGLSGPIYQWGQLVPTLVIPGGEVWRLLSYPLCLAFLDGLALMITFYAPSEDVEQMLGKRQFGLLLLMLTLAAGLLHIVLFWGEAVPMFGASNIVLFTLIGAVYLFPANSVPIFFFSIRSWIVLLIIGLLALASPVLDILNGGSVWTIFSRGGFGAIVGAAYFHVRYQKYDFMLGPIRSIERVFARMRVQAGGAHSTAPQHRTSQQSVRIRLPIPRQAAREMTDEERLNYLLDRIHDKGYGSLTDDDRSFLDDYSARM